MSKRHFEHELSQDEISRRKRIRKRIEKSFEEEADFMIDVDDASYRCDGTEIYDKMMKHSKNGTFCIEEITPLGNRIIFALCELKNGKVISEKYALDILKQELGEE